MKIFRIQIFLLTALIGLAAGPALFATEGTDTSEVTAAEVSADATQSETGQPGQSDQADLDSLESFYAETTVTATGTEVDTFEVSTPVTVLDREEIDRRMPQNASELLRSEPGVDVNGVGPNQSRPVIRGLRGLRVLFLENGLRMNNARRQTDFGETPGLVDIESVEAVEVVRGPSSVLYGSDAIGGVLNLVTRGAVFGGGVNGSAGLLYGTAGDLGKAHVSMAAGTDRWSYQVGLTRREVDEYEAPSGTFGQINLTDGAPVVDTGVDDDDLFGHLGYQISDQHQLLLRVNRYRADQTGFGFVEPDLIGNADPFRIRIVYPFQNFDRYSLEYIGAGLESVLADTVEFRAYQQSNERQLANDIDVFEASPHPGAPGTLVASDTLNFTDLETTGMRLETVKGIRDKHLLTYGVEVFEDDSFNTDSSQTSVSLIFDGPPFVIPLGVFTDTLANSPNASNESQGVFAQLEMAPTERLKVAAGARYQKVETRAEATPGWDITGLDFEDDSVVGALSLLFRATDNLRVVGSVGTAFRAPNLVERLFNGPTPEGAGFQVLNQALVSEESENFDLGLKYRRRNVLFDLTYFRNDIDNGIVQYFFSPAEIGQLSPELQQQIAASGVRFVVQQRNADRLRYEGVELRVDYRSNNGWSTGGNYTHLEDERIDSLNPPTGDSFGDKLNVYFHYQPDSGRYWLEYRARHNGDDQANIQLGEPVPPVGDVLPAFTIHTLSGNLRLASTDTTSHDLTLAINNVTDELYAEFSNATFFRPEPERSVTLGYRFRY